VGFSDVETNDNTAHTEETRFQIVPKGDSSVNLDLYIEWAHPGPSSFNTCDARLG